MALPKLALITLILMSYCKYSTSNNTSTIKISHSYGNTKIFQKGKAPQKASIKSTFHVGDILHAGGNSIIDLKYKRLHMRLVSNATLKFISITKIRDIEYIMLELVNGILLSTTPKNNFATQLSVKTSSATVDVSSCKCLIAESQEKSTIIYSAKGLALVQKNIPALKNAELTSLAVSQILTELDFSLNNGDELFKGEIVRYKYNNIVVLNQLVQKILNVSTRMIKNSKTIPSQVDKRIMKELVPYKKKFNYKPYTKVEKKILSKKRRKKINKFFKSIKKDKGITQIIKSMKKTEKIFPSLINVF